MMRLCIDTNIYSALISGNKRIQDLLQKAACIIIPTIVLGELYAGFQGGTRHHKNISELEEFLLEPGVEVVAADHAVARRYAIVLSDLKKKGTPIPTNDVWIAAITFETGTMLATFDNHFCKVAGLGIVEL
jgi:tRNA(fMet)-specific endonuclease VapC